MATTLTRFDQLAMEIVHRAGELLEADISILDEHQRVVASNDEARPRGSVVQGDSGEYDRIPLNFDGWTATTIVSNRSGEVVGGRDLTQVLLDMLIQQIAVAQEAPTTSEVKDRFIHKLLRGALEDEEPMRREAQILGMDLTQPRAVILIDAADFIRGHRNGASVSEMQARQRAERVIDSIVGFFTLPDDTICGYIGDGEVVVLKASSTRDLAPWSQKNGAEGWAVESWANLSALRRACDGLLQRLQHDTCETVTVGVGRYHPGISGISRSYQDARAALSLGRHFSEENRVHCLNDIGLAAFVGVSDASTKFDLADYLLGPLDHEPDLVETLEVFFASDCCPSSAAHALCIHRNTVSYRLHKVNSLIGLNPTKFEDAVQIRLALALRCLRGERG